MLELNGIIAATYTPLHQNGDINTEIITRYYQYLKDQQIDSAFINGSTGDFPSLTMEERMSLTEAWCKVADDGFTTMIHVGDTSIRACQLMAAHAGECGAKAISTLAPFYFKPGNLNQLIDFCAQIAEINPEIPFIYYHLPALTGVDFDMTRFLNEGKKHIPNLIGIKFTKHELHEFKDTLECNGGKNVLFGVDEILLSSLALGATGWVGSTYNHLSSAYKRVIAYHKENKHQEAAALQHKIMQFVQITAKYGWAGSSKWLLERVGLELGPVRSPHHNPSKEEKDALVKELNAIGFFDLMKEQACEKVL